MASSSRPDTYKRSRNVLSIETKTEIITRLGKGETVSSLARIFNVGKATVSDIKSNKDKIMSFASKLDSEIGSKKRKTMRNAKDVKLEEALYLWFMQRRSKGEPISGSILCEKALQFNNQLDGPPDFKASQGWLRNFKSRHGIQDFEIQVESLPSVNISATEMTTEADTFDMMGSASKAGIKLDQPEEDVEYLGQESMGSYSLLPRSSIKLEPACETDHVHSSAKVMIIDAHAFDEVDSASPASIKKEQPEEDVEYPDQETLVSSQNCPYLSMQEQLGTQDLSDVLYKDKQQMFTKVIDMAGCSSDHEMTSHNNTVSRVTGNSSKASLEHENCSHISQNVSSMLGSNTQISLTDKNCQLQNDMEVKTGDRQDMADVCDPEVSVDSCLSRHKRKDTEEEPFKYDLCSASFTSSGSLKFHMRTNTGEKPYQCDDCGASFARANSLKTHRRIHTGEKHYKCDDCGTVLTRANDLKIHKRRHTGEKPYRCEDCGEYFTESGSLTKHKRRHTGESPYRCDDCGAVFTHAGSLKTHKRIHTGEKPFKCDDCGESFNENSSLKKHKRTHTGEKPYWCDDCGATFSESTNLAKHKRTHTGERPFSCDDCGSVFTRAGSLKTHMRIHTGEKPYKCDDCGASFTQVHHLKRHKRTHTGKTPLRCEDKLIDTAEKLLQV